MKITGEGIKVYPRLVPERHERSFTIEKVSSGVPEIDRLLNGGLERGSVTFISGPSGVGKTTLGMQFMREAAGRGERSVAYLFEEMKETLITRSKNVNIPVEDMIDQGALSLEEIESLDIDTNQFGYRIREEVEHEDASIVMIDGMEGYSLSVRGDDLISDLHALGRYLTNMGVTAIIVAETKQITGAFNPTEHGGTYLADNLIFLRHLEIGGEMRKSIGVLKKRMSDYERMLREFRITQHGIQVGEPLTQMRGILSGSPDFVGEEEKIRMNSLKGLPQDD